MDAAIYATAGLLFVAMISGLSFLAVQYPKTFSTLSAVGGAIFSTSILVLVIYEYGATTGGGAVLTFVPAQSVARAKAALNETMLDRRIYLMLGGFAFFMAILALISRGVEREKKEIDRTRENGK